MQYCRKCPNAVAQIQGGREAPQLTGCVQFYQECGWVLIVAKISGLPESEAGFFGFHIHQGESCSGTDFSGTGSHYNPTGQGHPKHAGDLPPLLECRGNAYLSVKTDRFSVKDIIGRTVVIHSDPDDFHSQPAGNAGKKIACGVIRKWRQ
ncbi:MAG: superoxide dismutase family protein [Oscillospiraceae bacterium]|nr:superoxide dismutase family protein [Oscillospiraceae bacterium]